MKIGVYPYIFIALDFSSCNLVKRENTSTPVGERLSSQSAFAETLFRLDSALMSLRADNQEDPDFGALWCPRCKMYHSRAAEALYLHAAIDLGNWLIAQQEAGGSWKETPEEWTGTTTNQLLMMALARMGEGNFITGEGGRVNRIKYGFN